MKWNLPPHLEALPPEERDICPGPKKLHPAKSPFFAEGLEIPKNHKEVKIYPRETRQKLIYPRSWHRHWHFRSHLREQDPHLPEHRSDYMCKPPASEIMGGCPPPGNRALFSVYSSSSWSPNQPLMGPFFLEGGGIDIQGVGPLRCS